MKLQDLPDHAPDTNLYPWYDEWIDWLDIATDPDRDPKERAMADTACQQIEEEVGTGQNRAYLPLQTPTYRDDT